MTIPEKLSLAQVRAHAADLRRKLESLPPGSDERARWVEALEKVEASAEKMERVERRDSAFLAGQEYGHHQRLDPSLGIAFQNTVMTPTERLVFIVGMIAGEFRKERGWKTYAAERLNLQGSQISRLIGDAPADVKPETLDRAQKAIGLTREFFWDDKPGFHLPEDYLDPTMWAPGGGTWGPDNPRPEHPRERGLRTQEELILFHAKALIREVSDQNGRVDPWRALQLARSVKELPIVKLADKVDTRFPEHEQARAAIDLAIACLATFGKVVA